MRILIGLTLILIPLPSRAALPFDDGFATGKSTDYVEGTFPLERLLIVAKDGVNTLTASNTQFRFKPALVTSDTKYSISFDCSFAGDVESLEENPRLAVFAQPKQRNAVLPARRIVFLNAAGKPTGNALSFSMPFRTLRRYTDVFYTPPATTAVRLEVQTGDGVIVSLQNLSLQETADEGALNVNPAFRLGAFNYSGWTNVSNGGKIVRRNNQAIFDTKYGSRGATFPLPGPGTYALSAKATGNGFNSCVKVDVFDANGKKLLTTSLRQYDRSKFFIPPPTAVSASLLVYSCLLEEVRVVRVGDAAAMDRFSN